ncbi:acyltransferase family protein [Hoylesella marshii]|uniref:Acyltransferase n=1 Tax=Hoylesella marshii DSM 16973 = JCM 13450 TaxID=862515 RepID=E0NT82_9BACT|nr:acyltransferase [Hoylesella marshii]EFM01654.1 acyltransferase [Hoylesella marshii DSM 16973 = JCM 13450]
MRWKEIEWADLSRYRGELMGAAMLFIVLFHVDLPRYDLYYGLRRCGNVGVDMFLFLSGIGLWYSWSKNTSLRQFFLNRYIRIYPAWFIVASLYYIPRFKSGHSIIGLLGDTLINSCFWIRDELTFWYVPAIMVLYCFAPAYMTLIKRNPAFRWLPVLMMAWCVAVQWVAPIHSAVGHIEIFWSRVPIFFLGINCGQMVRSEQRMQENTTWLVLMGFLMTAGLCIYLEQMWHGRFPLFIERMVYIPLTVTCLLLLCKVFRHTPDIIRRFFRLLGIISLELYLIHIQFVMRYVTPHHIGYWPTALITLAVAMPLAWALHTIIEKTVSKMPLPRYYKKPS